MIKKQQERARENLKSSSILDVVTLFHGTQKTKSVTQLICQWSPLSEPQYTEKKKTDSHLEKKWTQEGIGGDWMISLFWVHSHPLYHFLLLFWTFPSTSFWIEWCNLSAKPLLATCKSDLGLFPIPVEKKTLKGWEDIFLWKTLQSSEFFFFLLYCWKF